jgi:hypothetical protein
MAPPGWRGDPRRRSPDGTGWHSFADEGHHVIAALQQASMIEPDPAVRDRMRQLLATWTTQDERPHPDRDGVPDESRQLPLSPARSVANQEFHQTDEHTNRAARVVAQALQDAGHRALNPPVGFPQEMDRFPVATSHRARAASAVPTPPRWRSGGREDAARRTVHAALPRSA